METIVDKFVLELEAQLRERKVAIDLKPEARAHLAKKGFDPVYGARPLNRLVQTEVRNPLTDEILFGQLEHGGTVHVGFDGEKLTFEYDSAAAAREPHARPPAGVRGAGRVTATVNVADRACSERRERLLHWTAVTARPRPSLRRAPARAGAADPRHRRGDGDAAAGARAVARRTTAASGCGAGRARSRATTSC